MFAAVLFVRMFKNYLCRKVVLALSQKVEEVVVEIAVYILPVNIQ